MSKEAGRSQNAKSVGMPRACMLSRALMTAPASRNSTTTSSAPWKIRPRQNGSFQNFGRGGWAVAAFIAARGVTRPELTPADRLRHLGYEVLAHGKGVILDRKTVLADEVAIAAFLAARETPRAA